MPYFLYRISPERKLTLIETFEKFQDAKTQARQLRAAQPADNGDTIRMIFAETSKKAQLLLTDLRNPKTDGDD
jgi:hypothetical protein